MTLDLKGIEAKLADPKVRKASAIVGAGLLSLFMLGRLLHRHGAEAKLKIQRRR